MNNHWKISNEQWAHFYRYKDIIRGSAYFRNADNKFNLAVRASVASTGPYYVSTNVPQANMLLLLIKLGLHI